MAEELQVRYRRGIGITLVMASIFVLLDAFVVSLKGGFPFSLISGFITLYGGYLFVNKTYLTLSKHELTLYKLTGNSIVPTRCDRSKTSALTITRLSIAPKKQPPVFPSTHGSVIKRIGKTSYGRSKPPALPLTTILTKRKKIPSPAST